MTRLQAGSPIEQHLNFLTPEHQGQHCLAALLSGHAVPCRPNRIVHLGSGARAVFPVNAEGRIRRWALLLDLALIGLTSGLARIPLLAGLHRGVTADVEILPSGANADMRLRVSFRSPYLSLPLQVERSQIGSVAEDGRFKPAAFRFFDWQTWRHIDGDIDWTDVHRQHMAGETVELVTGFTYRVSHIPASAEVLGLRVAEGVEGTARIWKGGQISAMKFDPGYWMLESKDAGYNPVEIHGIRLHRR